MTNLSRRGILGAIICAPAIIRVATLMPIKVFRAPSYVRMDGFMATLADGSQYHWCGPLGQEIYVEMKKGVPQFRAGFDVPGAQTTVLQTDVGNWLINNETGMLIEGPPRL